MSSKTSRTSIYETLVDLGLTSKETRFIYNNRTRDNSELPVWKDAISSVIFIDDYYVGDDAYNEGAFRQAHAAQGFSSSLERKRAAQRRLEETEQYIVGKNILEFGCGAGDYIRKASKYAKSTVGVELEKNFVNQLCSEGIECVDSMNAISDSSIDTIMLFHVFEHLPNPMEFLAVAKDKLRKGGHIVIEVPNANDFLLANVKSDDFKQFTLWSQHLMLHTKESLRRFLVQAGFSDICVRGVQRYPLSNHLGWLANGKPGGHKTSLSEVDTPRLNTEYEQALGSIDATDTLFAVASF